MLTSPNLLIWLPQAEHLESHADSVRYLESTEIDYSRFKKTHQVNTGSSQTPSR